MYALRTAIGCIFNISDLDQEGDLTGAHVCTCDGHTHTPAFGKHSRRRSQLIVVS